MRKLILTALLASSLITQSCSGTQIVNVIELALNIALTAASATGTIPQQYTNYISASLGCIQFSSTELASEDSSALKTDKIFANCSGLIAPNLPAGTPQNLINQANQVAVAIQNILSQLPSKTVTSNLTASIHSESFFENKKEIKLSKKDKEKLKELSKKAKEKKVELDKKPVK